MEKEENRPISEIFDDHITQSHIKEAEARNRLIQQGVIKSGKKLKLPATLIEAMRRLRGLE